MLKVDNIISLWRVIVLNMVSELHPKISHVNKILKYRTKMLQASKVYSKLTQMLNKGCTLFEGFRGRSRASIKGRSFEGYISLRRGSMVTLFEGGWLGGSRPTLAN